MKNFQISAEEVFRPKKAKICSNFKGVLVWSLQLKQQNFGFDTVGWVAGRASGL